MITCSPVGTVEAFEFISDTEENTEWYENPLPVAPVGPIAPVVPVGPTLPSGP